jgi:hypothetical protein
MGIGGLTMAEKNTSTLRKIYSNASLTYDCLRLKSEPSGEEVFGQHPGTAGVTIGHSTYNLGMWFYFLFNVHGTVHR